MKGFKMNKWIVAILSLIGVVVITLVVSQTIVSKKNVVQLNEDQILTELVQTIDSVQNKNSKGFAIRYRNSKFGNEFIIDLNYGDKNYSETFSDLESFLNFISKKEMYYDNVMRVSN